MRTADSMTRERLPEWEELEYLIHLGQGRRRRLTAHLIDRLGILYRRAVSDLARARRDFPGDRVTAYLESLASRAHPIVFRGQGSALHDLGRLLAVEFPRAVRSMAASTATAALLFFGAALVAFVLALLFPAALRPYLPAAMLDRIEDVGEAARTQGSSAWVEVPVLQRPFASYAIATNNIQVTLLAFAGGAVLGLLTMHVLVLNGLVLGLVAGLAVHEGAIVSLGTFVSAHGFVELSVITLAGGAGLAVGHAFLRPGDRPRLEVVVAAARRAVVVAVGGAFCLVLSGAIEGLLSPSELPPWTKLLVGLTTGLALWAFLLFGGRAGERSSRTRAAGAGLRPSRGP